MLFYLFVCHGQCARVKCGILSTYRLSYYWKVTCSHNDILAHVKIPQLALFNNHSQTSHKFVCYNTSSVYTCSYFGLLFGYYNMLLHCPSVKNEDTALTWGLIVKNRVLFFNTYTTKSYYFKTQINLHLRNIALKILHLQIIFKCVWMYRLHMKIQWELKESIIDAFSVC